MLKHVLYVDVLPLHDGRRTPEEAFALAKAHQITQRGLLDKIKSLAGTTLRDAAWTLQTLALEFDSARLEFRATTQGVICDYEPCAPMAGISPPMSDDLYSLQYPGLAPSLWSPRNHAKHRIGCRFTGICCTPDHLSLYFKDRPILMVAAIVSRTTREPILVWQDDLDERYAATVIPTPMVSDVDQSSEETPQPGAE